MHWGIARDKEWKEDRYPYADDLQYPATEYFWDGKDWRHPNLEYPAREYWFDGKEWIHDTSCPWDKEYLDPEIDKHFNPADEYGIYLHNPLN